MDLKFYKLGDEIVELDASKKVDLEEIVANTVDAAKEKHVPVLDLAGTKAKVSVGEVIHPMLDNHYIEFIVITTNKCAYKRYLKPGEQPVVVFTIEPDEVVENVYAYCNLHGLWKTIA